MSLYRDKISLQTQLIEAKNMLDIVRDNPLMAYSMQSRIESLEEELASLPETKFDPTIVLLFSGDAVAGSRGIKADFLGKSLTPFQEIVKTQVALQKFGRVGLRGRSKEADNSELFLTSLPRGSFGVELSKLKTGSLFDDQYLSEALQETIETFRAAAESTDALLERIQIFPPKYLSNLKAFLKTVAENHSILKMETGATGLELTEKDIDEAYGRVSRVMIDHTTNQIQATFKGVLLESGKFEAQDLTGALISGYVAEHITGDDLERYNKEFTNRAVLMLLKIYTSTAPGGRPKSSYELLDIKEATSQFP